MKRYQLKKDHQGFLENTIFVGPLIASDTQKAAFFLESDLENTDGKSYFYASHVTGNPLIFEEIKEQNDL